MNQNLKCKACSFEGIKRFLSLGEMPPVNAFISYEQIKDEKAHPLNLAYCPECFLVQLEQTVPPEELFRNYLHLSAGSVTNINYLEEIARYISNKLGVNQNSKILEIGSNDGTLLSFFKKYTNNVLGVDPAENLIKMNKEKGIDYVAEFFNTSTASKILKEKGKFDLIIGLNVIPHTPDNINLLKAVRIIMQDHGTLIIEGVYALETILRGEFDTIYHEHVYTYSLHALMSTFRMTGMTIVDVEKIPTQGGSLRVYAMKDEYARPASETVKNILAEEKKMGLDDQKNYDAVAKKVENYRKELRKIVDEEKKKSGRLIGLGAPARGVVILNYCGLGIDDIEYLIDDTPLKQGKVAPGVHIPVKSWEELKSYKNQTFLLLSWNYKDHLISKVQKYAPSCRIIIPFPNLEVKEIG